VLPDRTLARTVSAEQSITTTLLQRLSVKQTSLRDVTKHVPLVHPASRTAFNRGNDCISIAVNHADRTTAPVPNVHLVVQESKQNVLAASPTGISANTWSVVPFRTTTYQHPHRRSRACFPAGCSTSLVHRAHSDSAIDLHRSASMTRMESLSVPLRYTVWFACCRLGFDDPPNPELVQERQLLPSHWPEARPASISAIRVIRFTKTSTRW